MKTKVSLGLSRKSVLELVGLAMHVVSNITGNAFFTPPTPALIKVSDAADGFALPHKRDCGTKRRAWFTRLF